MGVKSPNGRLYGEQLAFFHFRQISLINIIGLLHAWDGHSREGKDSSLFAPELTGRNLAAPIGRDE